MGQNDKTVAYRDGGFDVWHKTIPVYSVSPQVGGGSGGNGLAMEQRILGLVWYRLQKIRQMHDLALCLKVCHVVALYVHRTYHVQYRILILL